MKAKVVVNNKIKAFGQADTKTGVVEINVKKHKNDKKQLADSIKHEIYHVKHPKATEKATIKNTGKLENMSNSEQNKLLAKLRMKKINYAQGVTKRKLHLKGNLKPGQLIQAANEGRINSPNNPLSKTDVAILGMI